MEAFTFNTAEIILLSGLSLLCVIQFIYYVALYNRIHRRNVACRKEEIHFTSECLPLSVVICARNESENLLRNLPSVLEQDYPNFEVVVINDGSTDESTQVLSDLEEKYPHLYHSFTPESARYISRKKLALTLGIKASKHNWLVFTEANCQPVSNQWLRLMARNFTPRTEIVLGYNSYERGKGWRHRYIAFDSLFNSLRYLGFALAGRPYMGMGRNMAYRKELFFNKKGYSSHLNLQRGEDDLFINQIATPTNTRVETDSNAVIRMRAIERHKDWKEEKMSYLATSRCFKGFQRYLLGFETTSRLLFYATFIATLVFSIMNLHYLTTGIALFLFFIRYLTQAIVINKTATDMNDARHFYLTLPLFDLIQPLKSLHYRLYRLYRGKGDFMRR
ncbi:glycosyltransferase [Bacteroides sp.]|uniref:glycosyltransferase n=1 Tax=Bacteroides sp. TaxID=29523 RepID=UPI001B74E776|nr:glycosyltransferase [Bacteroides sp.]MBP6065543.1 glycosyltransferase [Bacteroides sp.]MBP6067629.1 glycosyltransferase [Bacteroides sp.]MBP6936537.1 glycosyltransferase [Bacteroides sp.]MBP8622563.1 glycosyltransferase [Bacteroides sp.]MBP9508204.1 glycosyltransferase [Bacteroides sp.]